MKLILSALLMMIVTILPGCGGTPSDRPNLAPVQGVVTLDGNPVEGAIVTFLPEKGRPSSGVSGKDGHYQLNYIREIMGAALGHHQVQITTVDRSEGAAPFKELFPAKYNSKTELTADVVSGKNTINFDLESK
ncbi:MAG TPA: hypothetical protein VNQ76_09815 [Planctomicrobium sp.]|nr:hypothetical protein [Planctomicrobium sp.]